MLTNVPLSEKDHRSESNLTTAPPPRHVSASNGPELKGRDVSSSSSAFIRGLCALSLLRMQSYRGGGGSLDERMSAAPLEDDDVAPHADADADADPEVFFF